MKGHFFKNRRSIWAKRQFRGSDYLFRGSSQVTKGQTFAIRWHFPFLISKENKLQTGILVAVLVAGLYLFSNHFQIFQPRELPLIWIDRQIPFIPHTIWIYLSDLFLLFSAFFLLENKNNIHRFLYSFLILNAISAFIFWFFPTVYPRYLFPPPDDLDKLTKTSFALLRQIDSANNCAPSLHVSGCFLAAFAIRQDKRNELFFPYCAWAIAISISTLTLKQHYFFDVASGFLLSLIIYSFIYPLISVSKPTR